jgi:hypothetical protein
MSLTPATPLEAAVQNVRTAQIEYDQASENYERLAIDIADARVRRDSTGEALSNARNDLFEAAVKPTQYVTEPIRVAPTYLTENDVRLEEGVDAAWSDKGPNDEA